MPRALYVNPVTGGYFPIGKTFAKAPPAVVKANLLLLQTYGTNRYVQGGNQLANQNVAKMTLTQVNNSINVCLEPLLSTGELVRVVVNKLILPPNDRPKINLTLFLPSDETAELTI